MGLGLGRIGPGEWIWVFILHCYTGTCETSPGTGFGLDWWILMGEGRDREIQFCDPKKQQLHHFGVLLWIILLTHTEKFVLRLKLLLLFSPVMLPFVFLVPPTKLHGVILAPVSILTLSLPDCYSTYSKTLQGTPATNNDQSTIKLVQMLWHFWKTIFYNILKQYSKTIFYNIHKKI